jgi:hypothetical protein
MHWMPLDAGHANTKTPCTRAACCAAAAERLSNRSMARPPFPRRVRLACQLPACRVPRFFCNHPHNLVSTCLLWCIKTTACYSACRGTYPWHDRNHTAPPCRSNPHRPDRIRRGEARRLVQGCGIQEGEQALGDLVEGRPVAGLLGPAPAGELREGLGGGVGDVGSHSCSVAARARVGFKGSLPSHRQPHVSRAAFLLTGNHAATQVSHVTEFGTTT